jgi:hypothetical protein
MPWEEEMRQIDDPVRLRRRAANLERELAAAPPRESTWRSCAAYWRKSGLH